MPTLQRLAELALWLAAAALSAAAPSVMAQEYPSRPIRMIVSASQGGTTDLLAVSFSANDYVGHAYGPDSPEAHETAVRIDKLMDKFFHYLDAQMGMHAYDQCRDECQAFLPSGG